MAQCARCGKKRSIFSTRPSKYCDECDRVVSAELADLEEKEAEEERIRCDQERQRRVERLKNMVHHQMERGGRAFLYEARFVSVDSSENGVPLTKGFAITHLQAMGLAGWEIVAVVPRTSARTLENKDLGSGLVSYAGGVSGTVDGVYILLKKEIPADWERDEESTREVTDLLATQAAMSSG